MIKNTEILEKLDLDEKLSLITDGSTLFSQGNEKAGIAKIGVAEWEEINSSQGSPYSAYNVLARSWNCDLLTEVAKDIAFRAKSEGNNIVRTPAIRVKSNPYTYGVSEDPRFVSSNLVALSKGIKAMNAQPCITGLSLTPRDIYFLDDKMDMRAMREYFFRPYKSLTNFSDIAVAYDYVKLTNSYADANTDVLGNMLAAIVDGKNGCVICESAEDGADVESIMRHTVSLHGNVTALRQAMLNYDAIKVRMGTGDASGTDLEAARREYSAVGKDDIDARVDKLISFTSLCSTALPTSAPADAERLAFNAATESIVLLKNEDGVLPLSRVRVAIIGDPAKSNKNGVNFCDFFAANSATMNVEVVGFARGYDPSGTRSDELENEALELARQADVALYFVATDKVTEEKSISQNRIKLPANILALSDKLSKACKAVVGILTSERPYDMSFDAYLSAVVLAETDSKYSCEALTQILLGVSNPSGRITETYYDNTDSYFAQIRSDRLSGKRKVGEFIGYRYYDAAEVPVKYPFGFGLGYSPFEYSACNIEGDTVEVTVTNAGRYDGSEVVQLYMGVPKSSVLRPAKELIDFKKVFLNAGESKVVKFKINPKLLTVYDETKHKAVVEGGEYEVFVASSVRDVQFTGYMTVAGENIMRDNKIRAEYFSVTSNILSEGYTFKDIKVTKKSGKKALMCGIIGASLSILLFLVAVALNALKVIDGVFGDTPVLGLTENRVLVLGGIAFGAMFLIFALVLVIGILLRRNAVKTAVTVAAKRSDRKEKLKDPYELLFEEEFKPKAEQPEVVKKAAVKETFDEEAEALRYLDPSVDFNIAYRQLGEYCRSLGLAIDPASAGKILAAFASSRLIILRSRTPALLKDLIKNLGSYFGSEECVQDYENFQTFEEYMNENTLNAVNYATTHRQKVQIAGLSGVEISSVNKFFIPLLKYVAAPTSAGAIKYGYDSSVTIPKNLWFVFALAENSRPTADDAVLINNAAFIDVNLAPCKPHAEPAIVKPITFYQLVKMSDSVTAKYPLDEDKYWKKVDKFEKYVNSRTPYHMGNKLWRRTEKFASVIRACGQTNAIALDCTVSCVVLPAVVLMLKDKPSAGGESLYTVLDNLFGGDAIQECKKTLNYNGVPTV